MALRVYAPPGVVLVRVEDIHLEYQAPALVSDFKITFGEYAFVPGHA